MGHSMGGQTARMLQYLLSQEISESEKTDDLEKSESSVPITWAYNHHYEAFLQGSNSIMIK